MGSRSLSRVLSWATIPLGAALPLRSSSLPGSGASHAMRFPIWPCFRWGLPCRPCYHVRGELLPRPGLRPTAPACAGAPFHPCLIRVEQRSDKRRTTLLKGTLSPCGDKPFRPSAVYSLLHFPSPHGARPLAGILLCEARTFLSARGLRLLPSGCLSDFPRQLYAARTGALRLMRARQPARRSPAPLALPGARVWGRRRRRGCRRASRSRRAAHRCPLPAPCRAARSLRSCASR